ncbi:MAG: acyl-CoA/acyl-ACP dehydrogenase [Burkholderiaceae bacterium]|nr:acyl-CoA/acyl-ACP dehydrogenase [Burkholderiaceae bacterium]
MDFELSEEQAMLADSCARLVRSRCGFEARRAQARSDPAQRPALWSELAALGVTALCVPEEDGGLARPLLDGALVAQALGRGWLLEPFVDCALAAPPALRAGGAAARPWLQGIASGEKIVVPLRDVQSDGARLRAQAPHASYADALLAFADEALWLIPAQRTRRRAYRQFDGSAAAEVEFVAADGQALTRGEPARAAWEATLAAARVGRIAEGVGLARAVLEMTGEYLRTRKQFGQPIGRFQALAHRMADLLTLLEQAQSLALAAAMRPDARTLDAAQVMAHRALRTIGQQAIQLHGGIGMTDEFAVSHYVKRLLAIELELGDADTALARFAAASLAAA